MASSGGGTVEDCVDVIDIDVAGFTPPMLREIVGGSKGASVCCGRSRGAGRGNCWILRLNLPGTNSEAPALRLLAMVGGRRADF